MSILKESFRIKGNVGHIKNRHRDMVKSGRQCNEQSAKDKTVLGGTRRKTGNAKKSIAK